MDATGQFSRTQALLGEAAMARLSSAHVLVVGVGGVGSWCAEALVRTGLGHITLMDDDRIAESNVNRQCPATAKTIGRFKVEAMAERLREISPAVDVLPLAQRYHDQSTSAGVESPTSIVPGPSRVSPVARPLPRLGLFDEAVAKPPFAFGRAALCCGRGRDGERPSRGFATATDLIIDAIDSVSCKAQLILDAQAAHVPVVSSMGAALRTDPTRVRVTRFEKVEGDGLARALRQRFRRLDIRPGRFSCVWSDEPPRAIEAGAPKGSLMPVTATFGMCLAAEAIALLTAKGGTQ